MPFTILLQFLLPPAFFSSPKHKAAKFFIIFIKILAYCYSLNLLGLHENRPIRANIGPINTNNNLDYVYQFWYNNVNLEVRICIRAYIWNYHKSM
jgi:hypothetical protein